MDRTIAVFGAGIGLGTAVARRFGAEGYRVALVARNRERLDTLAASLRAEGIDAEPFTADLTRPDEIPGLVERIGRIDVVEYAPITTDPFVPAAGLDPATMRRFTDLYLHTPIALVRAVLPGMLERGDGGILITQGASATHPRPFMSGVGPAMAAARNYVHSLHGEVAGRGVYAGVLHVHAFVVGSAGHLAWQSGELGAGLTDVPTVAPEELAGTLWDMLAGRDRVEASAPAA